MSAPHTNLDLGSVSYTTDELIKQMLSIQKAYTAYRREAIRRHMAERLVVGRVYQNWPNKNSSRPFAYPVPDNRFVKDEAFRRANTVRSLTRWQSFRAGLGFRARKVTEQRLYDLKIKNEPQASDSAFARAIKSLRRRGINQTIDDRANIDASAFWKLKARHDKGFAAAQNSFRKFFGFYIHNSLRIRDIMNTEKALLDAIGHLHALQKENYSVLFVDSKADFRRLFIENAKIPYSALGVVRRLNDFLANDAKQTGVRLHPSLTEPPPPSKALTVTVAAARPSKHPGTHKPAGLER